jgi:hypothetical protein
MRQLLILGFVFPALVACAVAEDGVPMKVHVGDSIVNGAVLKPYKNQWRVSVATPAGKVVPDAALWTDQLEFIQVNGRQCLQRTQVATFKKDGQVVGKTRTVNIFEPQTMAPVSRAFERVVDQSGTKDFTHIEFRDDKLHFERSANGKTERQEGKLETAAFDFYGGLYGLLLSALPLKTGFSATLPSVDEDAPTVSWVTIKVTGEEPTSAGPRGTIKAWVVEAESNLGPMKFWLSQDAPYILRLEYTAKDNGYRWKYEMI